MKKFGFIVFIVAILAGVVFANLFSFGRSTSRIFNISFGTSVKGSGVAKTEARETGDFKGVDVSGVFQVDVVAGKEFKVEVEADDNLLQYIKTEVRDDVLRIESSERLRSESPLRIRVSAPNIETIEASGASRVSVEGVKNSSISLDTSGASKVRLQGETANLRIEVSGASSIDASALQSQNADVDASGASNVDLVVTGQFNSEASGASRISYSGNPTSVEKSSSGASRISSK